ncbi:uncharacterized protein LOC134831741 [Culicoides brevitarsis]|uniref:uncharacterized protein LOC134831741 n=1 Tax=Culicoides brevitarsis TaxID=469753 RepID=UPI00307C0459
MNHETVRELMEQGFHPNFLEPYIIAAVRAQNIQDLQELLASNRHPLPFVLFDAFEVGNLEIIKLIFESGFVCLRPRDCTALLGVFKDKNDPSEAEQLKIFKYALPHFIENYNLKMDLEIFRLIANFHDNEKHGMVQYLMEIFYSEEKNKLFPLMKRLGAAVEDSHALLIILHSEIEYFEDSTLYIFTNLVEIFMIFVKLLLKDTPETMQLAIETFRLLLDKRIENIVANFVDIPWNFSHDESNSVAFKSPLLQKRLFQMVFHLFGSENDWMIWSLITSCFELCCREFRKDLPILSVYAPIRHQTNF